MKTEGGMKETIKFIQLRYVCKKTDVGNQSIVAPLQQGVCPLGGSPSGLSEQEVPAGGLQQGVCPL